MLYDIVKSIGLEIGAELRVDFHEINKDRYLDNILTEE